MVTCTFVISGVHDFNIKISKCLIHEHLSTPYHGEIQGCMLGLFAQEDILLGREAFICLTVGPQKRKFSVVIEKVKIKEDMQSKFISLFFSHPLSFAKKLFTSRAYTNKTTIEVIQDQLDFLSRNGFHVDASFFVKDMPKKKPMLIQYDMSCLDFIGNMLSDAGLYYFFDNKDPKKIIITDYKVCDIERLGVNAVQQNGVGSTCFDYEEVCLWRKEFTHKEKPYKREQHSLNKTKAVKVDREEDLALHYGECSRNVQKKFMSDRTGQPNGPFHMYNITSSNPSLCPGNLLPLSTGKGATRVQSLVVSAKHNFRLKLGGTHGEEQYTNSIQIRDPAVREKNSSAHKARGLVMAKVSSHNKAGDKKIRGKYFVSFDFLEDKKNKRKSFPVYANQVQSGEQIGVFFPMKEGDNVLVDFLNKDINQPFIRSVISDNDSSKNEYQYVIEQKSKEGKTGNYLKLKNSLYKPTIVFGNEAGRFSMYQTTNNEIKVSWIQMNFYAPYLDITKCVSTNLFKFKNASLFGSYGEVWLGGYTGFTPLKILANLGVLMNKGVSELRFLGKERVIVRSGLTETSVVSTEVAEDLQSKQVNENSVSHSSFFTSRKYLDLADERLSSSSSFREITGRSLRSAKTMTKSSGSIHSVTRNKRALHSVDLSRIEHKDEKNHVSINYNNIEVSCSLLHRTI